VGVGGGGGGGLQRCRKHTKGIEVVALPTREVCGKLERLKADDINAVLHVTC